MDPCPVEAVGGEDGGEIGEGALYKRKRQNSLNSSLQNGVISENQASLMKQLIQEQEMALKQLLQSRQSSRSVQKIQKQSESRPFSHGNQSAHSTANSTISTASPIPPKPVVNDLATQFKFAKDSGSFAIGGHDDAKPSFRNESSTTLKTEEQLTDFIMTKTLTYSTAPKDVAPPSELEQQMIIMQKRLMEKFQCQQENALSGKEKLLDPAYELAYDECRAIANKRDSFYDWFHTKAQLFHQKLHHSSPKPSEMRQKALPDFHDPRGSLNAYERYIAEHRRLEEQFYLQHQQKLASVSSTTEGPTSVGSMGVLRESHLKPNHAGTVASRQVGTHAFDRKGLQGTQQQIHLGPPQNSVDRHRAGCPQDSFQQMKVEPVVATQAPRKTHTRACVLAEQISNLAIGDEDDDSVSVESIGTLDSYDGKTTNVIAIRSQTRAQELACAELNDAIEDLYGASVTKVIKKFPTVTRFVRANDDSGNVQLHYAVRSGNLKAIKGILRADPLCALIRNNQGNCALHTAVEIGNFGAVRVICSMAPASARVQCDEGCLPLHHAVSSAAHNKDAPQITALLLNTFPAGVKISNDEGLLPLHLASMHGFSAGIRTIFSYGFSTITAREKKQSMIPLDFAVRGYYDITGMDISDDTDNEGNDVQVDTTSVFINRHRANRNTNSELSVGSGPTTSQDTEFWACINTLLASAVYDRPMLPSGNRRIFLPLHGAVALQPRRSTWKCIWDMYGLEHANDADVRGQTALHVLAASKIIKPSVAAEMVSDIHVLDIDAAACFDDNGLIPLHTALISKAPYAVVKALLECNEGSVTMEVDSDSVHVQYRKMLPYQLAAASDCSVEVIDLLMRAHPMGVAAALDVCY
mmetsp:Transcript_13723/g.28098  ORF Transcript_13723/g.28098 Transcript_13723/m.28098 type:complete len:866 (+) Transcript_13723:275-2872(+)